MKNAREKTFDRLARPYRLIEWLAYGPLLERVRFAHLGRLRDRRRILLLGDGDGRVLAKVCALAPRARIDTLDLSAGMLARAAARLAPADRARVDFRHEDALRADFEASTYDAVATFFFLDCFDDAQVDALIARLRPALQPGALWLFADFAEPSRGLPRLRARFWLAVMYWFFRWQTGLQTRCLPDSENRLLAAGFTREASTSFEHGFLRSVVFSKKHEDAEP